MVLFSGLIYGLFSSSVEKSLHKGDDQSEELGPEPVVEEITENLLQITLVADAIVFLLAAAAGYALSRKTLAPLRESYARQARFVEDAAHELRTPLAVMKAGSEVMLSRERSVAEYKKYAGETKEEISSLIRLSNDMLALARGDKLDPPEAARVPLRAVCERQVSAISAYAQAAGVSMAVLPGVEIQALCDEETFSRALLNILKNSIDYNKPQGSVEVSVREGSGKVVVLVRDTGVGISEADLPRLFDRFFRADRARSGGKGTGLGLSIAKQDIELSGGTISVSSELGKGSEFRITFPLA
jgi:signal transduction histidine kinase